jgi:hypothetical protein
LLRSVLLPHRRTRHQLLAFGSQCCIQLYFTCFFFISPTWQLPIRAATPALLRNERRPQPALPSSQPDSSPSGCAPRQEWPNTLSHRCYAVELASPHTHTPQLPHLTFVQSWATPRSLKSRGPRPIQFAERTEYFLMQHSPPVTVPRHTGHTHAAGSASHSAAPHTAHTQHTSATALSLAAATLPTTAHSLATDGGGLPKVPTTLTTFCLFQRFAKALT